MSTLYTTIPHEQLKSRLSGSFICKNGSRRYKYVVVKYNTAYFVKDEIDSPNKYSETDIIRMVAFLIANIYVEFGAHVYQQTVGIPMSTNCVPLVADLLLYSYEADFVQHLQKSKFKKRETSFNLTFRYIDNVLSLWITIPVQWLYWCYLSQGTWD